MFIFILIRSENFVGVRSQTMIDFRSFPFEDFTGLYTLWAIQSIFCIQNARIKHFNANEHSSLIIAFAFCQVQVQVYRELLNFIRSGTLSKMDAAIEKILSKDVNTDDYGERI